MLSLRSLSTFLREKYRTFGKKFYVLTYNFLYGLNTADDMLFSVNIAVPPGLLSEFHLMSDSDVQKLSFCLGQVSVRVFLNL